MEDCIGVDDTTERRDTLRSLAHNKATEYPKERKKELEFSTLGPIYNTAHVMRAHFKSAKEKTDWFQSKYPQINTIRKCDELLTDSDPILFMNRFMNIDGQNPKNKKYLRLKNLCSGFLNYMQINNLKDEKKALLEWGNNVDFKNLSNDIIGSLPDIAEGTVQNLRMVMGFDAIKTDVHVINTLKEVFGISKIKIWELIELCELLNVKQLYFDKVLYEYDRAKKNDVLECPDQELSSSKTTYKPHEKERRAKTKNISMKEILSEFWIYLKKDLDKKTNLFKRRKSTGSEPFLSTSKKETISKVKYQFRVAKEYAHVAVYLDRGREDNEKIYKELSKHKMKIENYFGSSLIWENPNDMKHCIIKSVLLNVDVSNYDDWDKMKTFLIDSMIRLEKAFNEPLSLIKERLGY